MAVAVRQTPETTPRKPADRLALGSLSGACYVLGALGLVFYGLGAAWSSTITPWLSRALNPFVDAAVFLLAALAVLLGLIVLGLRWLGSNPPAGIRAGIFTGAAAIVGISLLTVALGHLIAQVFDPGPAVGQGVTLGIGAALLIFCARLFFRPGFQKFLIQLEEQGWFSAAAYKRSQGLRVRRGTILGILVVVGSGIYTLLSHNQLGAADTNPHWTVTLPFSATSIVLLRDVRFTLPIVLSAAALWFAWRLVNLPTFADFLIATEAELNKVSWTTPRRLFQDTLVVLTTVVLVTLFIFLADLVWGWALSQVGVLHVPADAGQKQQKKLEW